MYAIKDEPPAVRELFVNARNSLSDLLRGLGDEPEPVLLPHVEDLFGEASRKGKFLVIRSGNFLWGHEQRDLFVLEPGDIVGVAEHFGLPIGTLRSDRPVSAAEYDAAEFLKKVSASRMLHKLWQDFLSAHYAAMTWFTILLMEGQNTFVPRVVSYGPGEKIIEEGSTTTDVYTLLEGGCANVVVDGVKVAEIRENQLFGMFTSFIGGPRTASVVAACPSLAVVVSQEDFIDLFRHMPDLAMNAAKDLARHIAELNARVVSLSKEKSTWVRKLV